jgi:hypothetical protein
MMQVARHLTIEAGGVLKPGQDLIYDRDAKFSEAFKQTLDAAGVKRLPWPPRSPNLHQISRHFKMS